MPKSPAGKKRPADVASNAVHVMRLATGEAHEDEALTEGKNPAAVALGRMGGKARAQSLSKREKSVIAKRGARARWKNKRS